MRKRILSLFLVVAMVFGIVPVMTMAAEPVADSNGVYQIGTPEELLWFAQKVNSGYTTIGAELTADIDLSNVTWPGIGVAGAKFGGSFDGKGHTVTFKDSNVGLFGFILGSEGAVATVQNVTTEGTLKSSGFAAEAGYAHFTNCINSATIVSNSGHVGGIVGDVSGIRVAGVLKSDVKFTNCANEASVSGSGIYVGGIVGYTSTNTRLDGCYNIGNIYGSSHVGGLVGWLQGSYGSGSIKNCYNTGTVTGGSEVGGLVGNQYNTTTITNCYNAGAAIYAIAGNRYNSTASISNSYYLGVKSEKCSPDFYETTRFEEVTAEISTRATSVTEAYMASAEFAAKLGSAFQQSCPTPVLTWQTAQAHTGDVCENCSLGSTEKEIYSVTFQKNKGYVLEGASSAEQDKPYQFTLKINEGYEKTSAFKVKVNGNVVTGSSGDVYTVSNVNGPVSVTVFGVAVIPGNHEIVLPGDGHGYRAVGDKTVARDEDYTFQLNFVDGFKEGSNFRIYAQEIVPEADLQNGVIPAVADVTGVDGIYTIRKVQKDYQVYVTGVEVVSKVDPVEVEFTITKGYNDFYYEDRTDTLMISLPVSVPYFDLSLYGLERYYYTPYCYIDENGSIRPVQVKGTPETAYDNITVMHAYIALTELYYFGYDPDEVGKGTSYEADPEAFNQAISWSQGAGSSFMNFWDFGSNLNYYLNYVYPLAYEGWGSTSDQILIKDGDVLSVHMITGNASGSRFGFFTVNDKDKKFTENDVVDSWEVDQGQKVNLTLYWTATTGDYSTGYELMTNQQLYWTTEDELTANVRDDWYLEDFGKTTTDMLITNQDGTVTINTADVEPGVYYFASLGGWTEGGAVDNDGFKSAGGETGPSLFKLVVKEYNGKLGDVNGDININATDAAEILKFVAGLSSEINAVIADVNGDGNVNATDAAEILKFVAGLITEFPADR